jgi:methylthioribose-1-phosphate isomerase
MLAFAVRGAPGAAVAGSVAVAIRMSAKIHVEQGA